MFILETAQIFLEKIL